MRSRIYDDPQKIYAEKMKNSCQGCKHIGWVEIGEKRVTICNIRNKFDNRKCTAYKDRGEE